LAWPTRLRREERTGAKSRRPPNEPQFRRVREI
jgi:hypothetical protein